MKRTAAYIFKFHVFLDISSEISSAKLSKYSHIDDIFRVKTIQKSKLKTTQCQD